MADTRRSVWLLLACLPLLLGARVGHKRDELRPLSTAVTHVAEQRSEDTQEAAWVTPTLVETAATATTSTGTTDSPSYHLEQERMQPFQPFTPQPFLAGAEPPPAAPARTELSLPAALPWVKNYGSAADLLHVAPQPEQYNLLDMTTRFAQTFTPSGLTNDDLNIAKRPLVDHNPLYMNGEYNSGRQTWILPHEDVGHPQNIEDPRSLKNVKMRVFTPPLGIEDVSKLPVNSRYTPLFTPPSGTKRSGPFAFVEIVESLSEHVRGPAKKATPVKKSGSSGGSGSSGSSGGSGGTDQAARDMVKDALMANDLLPNTAAVLAADGIGVQTAVATVMPKSVITSGPSMLHGGTVISPVGTIHAVVPAPSPAVPYMYSYPYGPTAAPYPGAVYPYGPAPFAVHYPSVFDRRIPGRGPESLNLPTLELATPQFANYGVVPTVTHVVAPVSPFDAGYYHYSAAETFLPDNAPVIHTFNTAPVVHTDWVVPNVAAPLHPMTTFGAWPIGS